MAGDAGAASGAPPPAGPRPPARPWWQPLVGAGSLGLGGLQVVAASMVFALCAVAPAPTATAFLLAGAAWAIPGAMLAVAGFGLLQRRTWAAVACLAACGLFAGSVVAATVGRTAFPPGVAEGMAWAKARPEAPPHLVRFVDGVLADVERQTGSNPLDDLRDPRRASAHGWVYAGWCACPVLPWYAVVLAAGLALRRSAARGRTAAP